MGVRIYSLNINKEVFISWEKININPYLYYIILFYFNVNENDYHSQNNFWGNMKKIFVIEINEKDKNIDNYDVVTSLEKEFTDFSEKLRENQNIYIHFKRMGNTWKDILDASYKNSKNNEDMKTLNHKNTNHLKVIK